MNQQHPPQSVQSAQSLTVKQGIRLYLEQLHTLQMKDVYLSAEAVDSLFSSPNKGKLDALDQSLQGCLRCNLCEKRNKVVFGVGNPDADLVFVGEGPGADEDREGIPFVGKAGQLLTQMIEKGMKIKRSDIYICNVVKCRPPGNRDPEPDEIAACESFLLQQLDLIQPKVIVALGRFAAQTLLRTDETISRMRGNWREYHGIKLMPTFHPSYLLRNSAGKRPAWEDLKKVMAELGLPV